MSRILKGGVGFVNVEASSSSKPRSNFKPTPKPFSIEESAGSDEAVKEISDIRNWPNDWSRSGVSGERLRNCIIYCLDYRENDFFRSRGITISALNNAKFVRLLDDNTPPGWTLENQLSGFRKKNPLPEDVAKWLMNGNGVNTPLEGWSDARQKLNAIKLYWYGKTWENQPDPDIDYEGIFKEHAVLK